MSQFHVVIATESRVSTDANPRQLSIPVSTFTQTGIDANGMPTGTTSAPQLHNMGDSILDITSPQILYAATWDGVSPWIVILKGDNSAVTMRYAGWPEVDEATWKAANPPIKI